MCYPSCALFSAPSCAVIILNGAPSSAPVHVFFKGWYTSFCCRENVFLYKIFFVLPIVCTFFCPIVCSYYFEWCPIERLFTFDLKVGLPQFVAVKISFFRIFFVLPIECTFFCPIVRSYYFEWCPIERTCLLFIQRSLYLN